MKNLMQKVSNKYNALGLGLFGMIASNMAWADGADLTSGLTTEAASGKAQLYTIGGIILGLCAVGVIIGFARRQTK
jgi:hypothetical protein